MKSRFSSGTNIHGVYLRFGKQRNKIIRSFTLTSTGRLVDSENLTSSEMSYLDPTGVRNADGTYRLVMSVAANEIGTRTHTLALATLSLR